MQLALLIAFSYLLGSVPFGVIAARARGIDLRRVGSGNIGATNVLRAAGKGPALFTLVGDLLKGAAAVALGRAFAVGVLGEGLMGLSVILGHDFSLMLRLRGGKGVATSLGVMLIYSPVVGILTVILWMVAVLVTRYSSLGALVSFAVLPVNVLAFDYSWEKVLVAVAVSTLLILRHADNIRKLRTGAERRIGEGL